MMKLHFRLRDFCSAALLVLFGMFLSFFFIYHQIPAFAEDDEVVIQDQGEHFVTIHDRDSVLTVKTAVTTVAEVLERSGIVLAETDIVEPGLDTLVTTDFNVNIYRAHPALVIDGVTRRYVMTASFDPKQIALEAGLTVYDGDIVEPEFNQNFLEAGAVSTYRLERNGGRQLTIEEALPYEVQTRYDYNRAKGERVLEQAGEEGRKVSLYTIEFENNVEVSRTLVSEEVVAEPQPEIISVGMKTSIVPEQETCANWAREAGVPEADLSVALELIYKESNCRVDATNASSGAYGIPQALPGNKMAVYGDDWQTNPVTQIRWMQNYVDKRYGGWRGALEFWYCIGTCRGVSKSSYWY